MAFVCYTCEADALYGESHIVNRDGSHQQLLSNMQMVGRDMYYAWTRYNSFLFLQEEMEYDYKTDSRSWTSSLRLRNPEGEILTLKTWPENEVKMRYREY